MTTRRRTTNALAAIAVVAAAATSAGAAEPAAKEVFEQRILPIFKSPKPSSCVECHLAGVDLKDYILPDAEKTFRSLRDQGLIDLGDPKKSKILTLIAMKPEAAGAVPLHAAARQAEYEAFSSWIAACAKDPALRAAPALAEADRAKPASDDAVIRHARKDRALEAFERDVWAWRFRCMNCHTEGTPQNDNLRKEHGDRVAWVKRAGARSTMEYLLQSRLVDLERPEKSLLLRKPLGEVPHEGGVKFAPGDQAYKGFRAWAEDVAKVRRGRYATAADLPAKDDGPLWFGTELWLKLENTHPDWADKLLQVSVYAVDRKTGGWEADPVATSDRVVFGKGRLWQHTLTLLAPAGSERAEAWRANGPSLPPGRYLVKVHVDRDGKLANDWRASLGREEYAGEAEFDARFRAGYGAMTTVDASSVRGVEK